MNKCTGSLLRLLRRRSRICQRAIEHLPQVITALPACVAAPVTDNVTIAGDDQSLRNNVTAVHQSMSRVGVSPTQAETKIEITDKLQHAIGCGARIFGAEAEK